MKKFLIFLSIGVVVVLAGLDAKDRMNELEEIAIKTPAQVEMKDDIMKRDTDKNTMMPKKPQNQNPDNSFNERLRQQQNNNLPQTRQPDPFKN